MVPTRRSPFILFASCAFASAALGGCGAGTTNSSPTPNAPITATVAPSTASPVTTPAPTASPSAPAASSAPIAIASDSVFASIGTGVDVFATSGHLESTFATTGGADDIGLDDAGNVYALGINSNLTITVARFAVGAAAPNATYAPTSARPQFILAGRNGTLVAAGAGTDASNDATAIYDVWDPGVTGAPSRTITYPNGSEVTLGGTVGPTGAIYIPYNTAAGGVRYDVIAPGTSTVNRTIVESIAPPNSNFAPNVMAAGSDGTLYVGEWTYESSDANAGLYVYPPSGAEARVTSGAAHPTGLDFDGAGNVFVANSNATIAADATLTTDTEHTLSEFTAGGASLVRQVSSGFDDPQNLAVDLDGTAYAADFQNADQTSSSIAVIAPSATTAATFAASVDVRNIVLFDGTTVRSGRPRPGSRTHAASRAFRLFSLRSRVRPAAARRL